MTDITKNADVIVKDRMCLVIFTGSTCANCKMSLKILEKMEPEYSDIKFYTYNCDEIDSFIQANCAKSLPCIVPFAKGVTNDRLGKIVGFKSEAFMREFVDRFKSFFA